MKSYQSLISEIKDSMDLQELEAGADLFQYNLEKGYYSARQSKEFNSIYWEVKNNLITDSIKNQFKGIQYSDLCYIVSKASTNIKEDTNKLIEYTKGILKNLKKSKIVA